MAYPAGHNHDGQYTKIGKIVTGTTSGTANTTTTFAHNLGVVPDGADVWLGNVYVTAVDATNITVGSAGTSQTFKINVFKN
jgi:hypothetical protein